MSFGDETYLEAFIEKLATLPHQLRRNLDLLRDLDTNNGVDLQQLRQCQQRYIRTAEAQVFSQLQLVKMDIPPPVDDDDDDDNNNGSSDETTVLDAYSSLKKRKYGSVVGPIPRPRYCVRLAPVESGLPSSSSLQPPPVSTISDMTQRHQQILDIPSTLEFMDFLQSDNTNAAVYQQILFLSQACLQKADEKVAIAHQTYDMLDAHVQRLDTDLAAMEQLLQATGEFTQTSSTVKPNDLAACQVTPGSEWILAKVIQYDTVSRMYKLADEDVESKKVLDVPEQQVVVLGGLERLSKGDVVFAVYPDTTSFYQATVVQAPRKQGMSAANASGGGGTGGQSQFLMVNFVDDADEFGITHDKAVPMQHIMMPPTSV